MTAGWSVKQGIYKISEGLVISGQFKANSIDGYSEIQENDTFYFGNVEGMAKKGFGVSYQETKQRVFIGFWSEGKPNGVGILKSANDSICGIWNNKELIKEITPEQAQVYLKNLNISWKVSNLSLETVKTKVEQMKNQSRKLLNS